MTHCRKHNDVVTVGPGKLPSAYSLGRHWAAARGKKPCTVDEVDPEMGLWQARLPGVTEEEVLAYMEGEHEELSDEALATIEDADWFPAKPESSKPESSKPEPSKPKPAIPPEDPSDPYNWLF